MWTEPQITHAVHYLAIKDLKLETSGAENPSIHSLNKTTFENIDKSIIILARKSNLPSAKVREFLSCIIGPSSENFIIQSPTEFQEFKLHKTRAHQNPFSFTCSLQGVLKRVHGLTGPHQYDTHITVGQMLEVLQKAKHVVAGKPSALWTFVHATIRHHAGIEPHQRTGAPTRSTSNCTVALTVSEVSQDVMDWRER